MDGYGVGDVGSVVLRDRKHLAEDGMIVVVTSMSGENEPWSPARTSSPVALYVKESEGLMEELSGWPWRRWSGAENPHTTDWAAIKGESANDLSRVPLQKNQAQSDDPACHHGGLRRLPFAPIPGWAHRRNCFPLPRNRGRTRSKFLHVVWKKSERNQSARVPVPWYAGAVPLRKDHSNATMALGSLMRSAAVSGYGNCG